MTDEPGKPQLPDDEDIAARFEKIREQLHGMDLPDLPEEEIEKLSARPAIPDVDHAAMDSRLDALEEKLGRARGHYQAAVNKPTEAQVAESSGSARGLATGLMIAYILMGIPLAFLGIGALVDWKLGGSIGKELGVLVGFIVAIAMTLRITNDNANKQS